MAITYKDSGVDIDLADHFVTQLKKKVQSTYTDHVKSGVGGFCSLYQMDEDRYLAASTDGVGTKLKLAIELNDHSTIGIDLVAMCVNDLICSGARPMFFLDYIASQKLDLKTNLSLIEGIVQGCKESGMALIGGETAEMPGVYKENDYDLAGFSVGEVFKDQIIDGSKINPGCDLVGIKSSGFHSNGYSLIRKVLDDVASKELNQKQLFELKKYGLKPTRIYVKSILKILRQKSHLILGLAHITGSGFLNIPRMNENFDYHITNLPKLDSEMALICQMSGLSKLELYKTFNMQIGLVIATSNSDQLIAELQFQGEEAILLGQVKSSQTLSQSQVFIDDVVLS